MRPNKIGLIGHTGKPGVAELTRTLAQQLEAKGLTVLVETKTAELAGISRVMGGYHIQADNIEGLALGRKVAQFEWPRIQAYFDGTAPGNDR